MLAAILRHDRWLHPLRISFHAADNNHAVVSGHGIARTFLVDESNLSLLSCCYAFSCVMLSVFLRLCATHEARFSRSCARSCNLNLFYYNQIFRHQPERTGLAKRESKYNSDAAAARQSSDLGTDWQNNRGKFEPHCISKRGIALHESSDVQN